MIPSRSAANIRSVSAAMVAPPPEATGAYDRAAFDKVVMPTYGRLSLAVSHGKGCYLWDTEGNRYLDFAAGISTCCLGHADPRLVEAVTHQISTVHHVSNLYYIPGQARASSQPCPAAITPPILPNASLGQSTLVLSPAWSSPHVTGRARTQACRLVLCGPRLLLQLGRRSERGGDQARAQVGPHAAGHHPPRDHHGSAVVPRAHPRHDHRDRATKVPGQFRASVARLRVRKVQ